MSITLKTVLKPLFKTGLITTALTLCTTLSAGAVTGLQAGTVAYGELTSQSLTDEYDETPYNLYLYQGVPGELIQFDMKSDDIDAYLIAGGAAKESSDCADCEIDDDGGEDYNSRLFYIVPEGGNIYVRAGTIDEEYGSYSLSAKKLANPIIPPINDLTQQVIKKGTFNSNSAIDKTGSYFDLFMVKGTPNQLMSVVMRSDDFDTYLSEVSVRGTNISIINSNDDANYEGDNTDSRLKVRLDDTGKSMVQATTLDSLETGTYTIQTMPINVVTDIKPKRRLSIGQTINSQLTDRSPVYLEDYHFDAYAIQGLPGERVTVAVSSDDFDTNLNWGYMKDGDFVILQENDDYYSSEIDEDYAYEDENTNSQFTVVLDRDGRNILMVTSYGVMATGNYNLSITKAD